MPHIFLTFRYKLIARRLVSNINLHGLLQDASLFISTDAFSFSRSLFFAISFFFPFLEEKEITSMEKWTASLSHFTILCIMTQFSPAPVRFDD